MSKIRGGHTALEVQGCLLLRKAGVHCRKHPKGIFGNPDAANKNKKLTIFFDSEFWHGYDWKNKKKEIKSNKKFWLSKIERNIKRDKEVNRVLRKNGWTVVRIWERETIASKRNGTIDKLRRIWRELDG